MQNWEGGKRGGRSSFIYVILLIPFFPFPISLTHYLFPPSYPAPPPSCSGVCLPTHSLIQISRVSFETGLLFPFFIILLLLRA